MSNFDKSIDNKDLQSLKAKSIFLMIFLSKFCKFISCREKSPVNIDFISIGLDWAPSFLRFIFLKLSQFANIYEASVIFVKSNSFIFILVNLVHFSKVDFDDNIFFVSIFSKSIISRFEQL